MSNLDRADLTGDKKRLHAIAQQYEEKKNQQQQEKVSSCAAKAMSNLGKIGENTTQNSKTATLKLMEHNAKATIQKTFQTLTADQRKDKESVLERINQQKERYQKYDIVKQLASAWSNDKSLGADDVLERMSWFADSSFKLTIFETVIEKHKELTKCQDFMLNTIDQFSSPDSKLEIVDAADRELFNTPDFVLAAMDKFEIDFWKYNVVASAVKKHLALGQSQDFMLSAMDKCIDSDQKFHIFNLADSNLKKNPEFIEKSIEKIEKYSLYIKVVYGGEKYAALRANAQNFPKIFDDIANFDNYKFEAFKAADPVLKRNVYFIAESIKAMESHSLYIQFTCNTLRYASLRSDVQAVCDLVKLYPEEKEALLALANMKAIAEKLGMTEKEATEYVLGLIELPKESI